MSTDDRGDDQPDAAHVMLMQGRVPGVIGRVVRATARTPSGIVALERLADGWAVERDGVRSRSMTVEQTAREMQSGALRLTGFTIVPELAPLLFQEAVRRASESVGLLGKAEAERPKVSFDWEKAGFTAYLLWAGFLDRAAQAAIVAVVMTVAAAEADVNAWAAEMDGWGPHEDNLDLPRKCQALAARNGQDLPLGSGPLHELGRGVRLRHDLVHGKPVEVAVNVPGSEAMRNARGLSIAARRTCLSVRRSLLLVARSIDRLLPQHVAYCPEGDPGDDHLWGVAEVMTGVREDSDFPRGAGHGAPSDPQGTT